MMRLDQESDLAVDAADQGIQHVDWDVDYGLAVGALQVGMRSRRSVVSRCQQGQVVNRRCTADVSVGDEPKLAKCGQSAIDRSPVNAGSRCLGAGDDFVSCEVIIGAVENLDDGLAGSGYALMVVAEQAQRSFDSGRGWHADDSIATLSHLALDAIPSHLGRASAM
jgi:hypothetical protein